MKTDRKSHPANTIVHVGNTQVGGGTLSIIAGPYSLESEEQTLKVAKIMKSNGITIFRGCTSASILHGEVERSLLYLKTVKEKTGLPIIAELTAATQLSLFEYVDVIQIGTQNMQNFNLLKAVGRQRKPVMIQRGMSATYQEWIMSAEYVMAEGNENIILCECGIRTFEKFTRNTLDLCCVPILQRLTHLPVVVDIGYCTGKFWMAESMSMGAIATGADGVILNIYSEKNASTFGMLSQKLQLLHNYSKQL